MSLTISTKKEDLQESKSFSLPARGKFYRARSTSMIMNSSIELPLTVVKVHPRHLERELFGTFMATLKLGLCTSLDLSNCKTLTDETCSQIFQALKEGNGQDLNKINLSGNPNLGEKTTNAFFVLSLTGQTSNLTVLDVSGLPNETAVTIVNQLWANLSPNLRSLTVANCGITDNQLRVIVRSISMGCPKLEFLDISGHKLTKDSRGTLRHMNNNNMLPSLKKVVAWKV